MVLVRWPSEKALPMSPCPHLRSVGSSKTGNTSNDTRRGAREIFSADSLLERLKRLIEIATSTLAETLHDTEKAAAFRNLQKR